MMPCSTAAAAVGVDYEAPGLYDRLEVDVVVTNAHASHDPQSAVLGLLAPPAFTLAPLSNEEGRWQRQRRIGNYMSRTPAAHTGMI